MAAQVPKHQEAEAEPETITVDLIFWNDGFTIGQGALQSYTEPEGLRLLTESKWVTKYYILCCIIINLVLLLLRIWESVHLKWLTSESLNFKWTFQRRSKESNNERTVRERLLQLNRPVQLSAKRPKIGRRWHKWSSRYNWSISSIGLFHNKH